MITDDGHMDDSNRHMDNGYPMITNAHLGELKNARNSETTE